MTQWVTAEAPSGEARHRQHGAGSRRNDAANDRCQIAAMIGAADPITANRRVDMNRYRNAPGVC